jgi:hypothetical protein
MSFRRYLDLPTVQAMVPLARAVGVFTKRVAGFYAAYSKAGGHSRKLPEKWKAKRSKVLDEAMAAAPDSLWSGGLPNRAHLTLVMWAYSPAPRRLRRFIASHPSPESPQQTTES